MPRLSFLIAFLFFAIVSEGQYAVKINSDKSANEPSVAAHRIDPSIIVAASNLNTIYYSTDTGHTWKHYRLTSKHGFYGDPVLHATNDGAIYITHLSKTKGKAWGAWFDRIVVQRSDDGGRSFNDGVAVGYNGDRTQDKPWLASDEVSDRFKGSLYLTWTEFDEYGSDDPAHHSRIRFSYSRDKGESWSDAITISDHSGDCRDDDNTLEGATVAVDEEGTLYCVWAGHDSIYMDISADGGISWNTDQVIGLQPGGWSRTVNGLYRGNGMPFIASDAVSPDKRSRIWVTWVRDTADHGAVKVIMSEDHGETWETRNLLARYSKEPSGDQLFVNIVAEPGKGIAYCIYSHVDDKGNGFFMRPYLAIWNDDHTELFRNSYRRNYALGSTFALPGKQTFFGDYMDIDYAHDRVHTVYTTTSTDGSLNIIYKAIPKFIKDTIDVEEAFMLGPRYLDVSHERDLAISFQDSIVFFCHDHLSRSTIKVINRKHRIGFGKRETIVRGISIRGKHLENATYGLVYDLIRVEHRITVVRARFWYYDDTISGLRKVKRKTKFTRKEYGIDIH